MTEKQQVYKCEICGNIVEVYHKGAGELVCCGAPMNLLEEKTADWKNEKHVPMIERIDGGFKVTVGSTLHPMQEDHFIEWIEITDAKGKVYRKHLNPGDAPEAIFKIDAEKIVAREHCNKHGLWKGNEIK